MADRTFRYSLQDSGVLWLDEVDQILDALEPHLRETVRSAFMAGVSLGGRLSTIKENQQAADKRADEEVQRWRSAR